MKTVTRIPARQSGAALVMGLVLLLVLTVLAISGMSTSTLELQMARNAQLGHNAFQSAEVGIERAMHSGNYNTGTQPPLTSTPYRFSAAMTFNPRNGETDVPSGGYSMGVGTGFKAFHFDVTSTGTADRNATSTHIQSFYIMGQASK